ncbi:ATP-binding cassette domain-containing protein [Metabacillus halosaccharovorans]|uniref:ABC transporter ATP-binding protein n=1 Tax=Metabacillus halosaccharovorans TaxID=930124 RepID=UPI00203D5A4C|nr:ATP-binding cassette domain-containing protein [Metabacillus halosaccharovorans]MCM3442633.1 ATP-binding cassette domain-containing protein [Metabacillus halosaccharovorans]
MIRVQSINKTYNKHLAVDDLTLQVKKGSIYGLLGSNGAGKTSLLKMIAGINRPDKGTIEINDLPAYENLAVKEKVVFIPDVIYFFPQATVAQMASQYEEYYPGWSKERFEQLSSAFNIELNRKVHRLSKGMKRQVAFWLALSAMPDVLILDEPIDGLDPVMRQKVKNLLFQDVAERGLTVIISSHNLREIEDLCDHVGIMHNGKIIIEKEIDDIKSDTHKIQLALADPTHEEHILNQLTILHHEKRGSVSLLIVRGSEEQINKIIHSSPVLIYDLLPLTLEEIFIYEMEDVGYEIEKILL